MFFNFVQVQNKLLVFGFLYFWKFGKSRFPPKSVITSTPGAYPINVFLRKVMLCNFKRILIG